VRILMTRWFRRFVRRERLTEAALRDAVVRAVRGQIDADLGGGVIKQRVARPGQGRSGGYRMIVLYRAGRRAIFAFGLPKVGRTIWNPMSSKPIASLPRPTWRSPIV
jgi:hypothetical protein